MNKEIIDSFIAIVMLVNDLRKSRVSNQASRFGAQKGGENVAKYVFDINLDMNREIPKPDAKRVAITHRLSRQYVQPKAHHHGNKTGIPEQEVVVLSIGRHSTKDLFTLIHVELAESKATEK